jgi:hypothetical protein
LLYNLHSFRDAAKRFEEVWRVNPEDRAAPINLARCQGIKSGDINNYKLDKFVQFKNTNDTVDDVVPVFPALTPERAQLMRFPPSRRRLCLKESIGTGGQY